MTEVPIVLKLYDKDLHHESVKVVTYGFGILTK